MPNNKLQLGRDKFHKSHAFDYSGDVFNFVGEHKSGIGLNLGIVRLYRQVYYTSGGQPLPGGKPKPRTSVYPRGLGSDKPAWVAFDRQVPFIAFSIIVIYYIFIVGVKI